MNAKIWKHFLVFGVVMLVGVLACLGLRPQQASAFSWTLTPSPILSATPTRGVTLMPTDTPFISPTPSETPDPYPVSNADAPSALGAVRLSAHTGNSPAGLFLGLLGAAILFTGLYIRKRA